MPSKTMHEYKPSVTPRYDARHTVVDGYDEQMELKLKLALGSLMCPTKTGGISADPMLLKREHVAGARNETLLGNILEAIQSAYVAGMTPLPEIVHTQILARHPETAVTLAQIQEVRDAGSSFPEAAATWIQYVLFTWGQSAVIKAADQVQALVAERVGAQPEETALSCQQIFESIISHGRHGQTMTFNELLEHQRLQLKMRAERLKKGINPMTFPPAWKILDDKDYPATYFEPGEMGILIAPTGGGKSTALMDIAFHLAENKNLVVLILLETGPDSMAQRNMTYTTGLPGRAARRDGRKDADNMGEHVEKMIARAKDKIEPDLLQFVFRPEAGVLDIRAIIQYWTTYARRKFGDTHRVIFLIDYGNAINKKGLNARDERSALTEIANNLKDYASAYQVPLILAVQMNSEGNALGTGDWARRGQWVLKFLPRVEADSSVYYARPALNKAGNLVVRQPFVCEKDGGFWKEWPETDAAHEESVLCPHCNSEAYPIRLHQKGRMMAGFWAVMDKMNDGEIGKYYPLILNHGLMRIE